MIANDNGGKIWYNKLNTYGGICRPAPIKGDGIRTYHERSLYYEGE
jgi:hypothetical protein